MDVRRVRVLLVGNAARKASNLEDYLLKRGCDICFATSQKDTLEVLRRRRFNLVLSEFVLSDGTAYQARTQRCFSLMQSKMVAGG
jgi:PleD family two-component response regulator